ncbi:MAG: S8/S53 family peptidase [Deltaproteobacteria bacterium]|nr:S8/S53 family peptidase [Deltaproteobacteria bacterium]
MKKIFIYLTILTVFLLSVSESAALEVRITGERLSIQADQVPLQSVLRRLADLGIRVRIDPKLNPKVFASFENWDMQRGLALLLNSFGYALIWESVEGPSGPVSKLVEIQVFERDRKESMKPLGTRRTLSIERNPRDGSLFVKGEVLLRLRPGISLLEFKEILSQIGGTLVEAYGALGIYKIRLPENADILSLVEQITRHPRIARAEPNYAYPISRPDYHADAATVSAPDIFNIPLQEGAAPVAILDTGLRPDSGLEGLVLASVDALNPADPISDSAGHGTQMALIAAGVVKPQGVSADFGTRSPIIPIKAFDDNNVTSNFNLMSSIDFAIKHGARVMSLSWSAETKSDFLKDALGYASSRGLIIVASAGNDPTGKPVYPAAYSSVIGVGALNPDGKPWKRSNYGDFVMLYAPGFATLPVGYMGDPGTYAGTSISTAFVANIISNYLSQNPNAKGRT